MSKTSHPLEYTKYFDSSQLLTGQMKRIPIVQDRQLQGCGCRAYMDVFTACLEQWVSFSSVSVIYTANSINVKSIIGRQNHA
jgi:hypothetical protein